MSERWGDSKRDRDSLDAWITREREDIEESGYDGPIPEIGSPEYFRLSPNHPARRLADLAEFEGE